MNLHRPWPDSQGTVPGNLVVITPEDAGWTWTGLHVLRLEPGVARIVGTGGSEIFVLPLADSLFMQVAPAAGGAVEATFELSGRDPVFTRVSDFAYVGHDSAVTLTSIAGAEVALPAARCERRREATYGSAADVPVEVRGAGPATRQQRDHTSMTMTIRSPWSPR